MSVSYELARCAVCGSADARQLASAEEMRTEVEALWAFHSRRLRPDIPPVHLMDRVAFSQHAPLRVVRCVDCGLVYRNPTERATELASRSLSGMKASPGAPKRPCPPDRE